MKTLREICRGIAKTFGFIRDADEKIASNVAAAMRTNVEQIKEYETAGAGSDAGSSRAGRHRCYNDCKCASGIRGYTSSAGAVESSGK